MIRLGLLPTGWAHRPQEKKLLQLFWEVLQNILEQHREITKYIALVKVNMLEPREGGEVVDTLNFWSEDDIKRTFPILCRIAAQVFVQEATTGDMKRINSRGGIYYTPHCNRLAPETVKKMIFLCGCYVRNEGGLTTR